MSAAVPAGCSGEPGSGGTEWSRWVDATCGEVEAAGRWRAPRVFDGRGHEGLLEVGGCGPTRPVVSFASNDYLGLTSHPAVVAAAHGALDRWGAGSGASRLVTGSRPVHRELETALAEWKGAEAAVVLPTGFAANLSVLSVFASGGVVVHSDELNHASIIDGCRLARADVRIVPHLDLDALDASLAAAEGRSLVVSDTVFSMDGDAADLGALSAVAARHGALLVLDEAHAVLGPDLSVAAHADVLRVGTLSKTLGALGGFVAGPARFVELLVNWSRPYIFTTAPTPADCAAALAAVGVVRSAEGDALRARLRGHVERVAATVALPGHGSPIVPVVIGSEDDAVAASAELLDQGLWVPAIRPPTVAPGTSRLRITLSATHTDAQVDRLVEGLGACAPPVRARRCRGGGSAVRPERIVLVCGTGTEVGKTWVAARLLRHLRSRGRTVSARKPAQSFDLDRHGDRLGGATDAEVLAAASGEFPGDVCHSFRSYHRAMAPPIAAHALGLPPSRWRTSWRSWNGPPAGSTWASSRRPAACVRPRPRTATPATWPPHSGPMWWSWWPTPDSAPSTVFA